MGACVQVSKVRLWREEGGALFAELKAQMQRYMDQVCCPMVVTFSEFVICICSI